jgi:Cu(I)/Ag(I) efflux system membrane fusion protein
MSGKSTFLLVLGLALGLAGGLAIPLAFPSIVKTAPSSSATSAEAESAEAADRQVLYWYDPMVPGTHFDKPGKSPFMDMDLIPRYADQGSGPGVTIDPVLVQNLGLKTALVEKGRLVRSRDLPANVEFNRYQEARVQPRAEGFVTSVQSLAVGDPIAQGQEVATITVPAWASDQSEYLLLKSQRADSRIIGGVREKLRLSGMPEEMLQEVDRTGTVQTTLLLTSPIGGVVTALDIYPGMNVEKNMTIAVIQGYDPIWVTAEVPEGDLELAGNSRLRVTSAAWPGRVFEVQDQILLPRANLDTRTIPLRLTVPNPEGLLKPGLTASIRLRNTGEESLIIPTQSLIDLGDEKRVITLAQDGSFVPKLVSVLGSSRGQTAVSSGLDEGEAVVVSGLFLIDSEANLSGALDRMRRPDGTLPAPESQSVPETEQPSSHGDHQS